MFDKLFKIGIVTSLFLTIFLGFCFLFHIKKEAPIEESRIYDQRYSIHHASEWRPYVSIFDKRFGFLYVLNKDHNWSVVSPFLNKNGDSRFDKINDLIPVKDEVSK